MDNDVLNQIAALDQEISEQPIGSIAKKTANGHVYFFTVGEKINPQQ